MKRSTWQVFAVIITFTLFAIGTWISIIGAVREAQTKSPGEGIVLIVYGASMMALSGLVVSVAGKLLGD